MACTPEVLRMFRCLLCLDEEETAVLAGQVELKAFALHQRINKMGDQPASGEFFGFASMREQTLYPTTALAL